MMHATVVASLLGVVCAQQTSYASISSSLDGNVTVNVGPQGALNVQQMGAATPLAVATAADVAALTASLQDSVATLTAAISMVRATTKSFASRTTLVQSTSFTHTSFPCL